MENKELKILAIDDIYDNLISLRALIREAFPGSIVLYAQNGIDGLMLAATEDPDVILLDIIMPGMDGFEVCRKLKGDKMLSDIPVVFITALKGDKQNRITALEAGAEAFLSKPVDETELKAQIRAMAKIKRANVEKRHEKERLTLLVKQRTRELEQELAKLKLAEDSLRKSENRYRALFMNQMEAYAYHEIICDANNRPVDYRFIEVNNAFLKLTGMKHNTDVVGKTVLEVWPDTEKKWIEIYGEIAETQQPAIFEKFFSPLKKYYSIAAYSIHKGFFSTSFWDITERKMDENIQKILYNISHQVLLADNIETMLETVRHELDQVFDTSNFFMALYSPEDDMLRQVIFKDLNDSFTEWKAGDTFSGRVVKQAITLLLRKEEITEYAREKKLFLKGTIPECWLGVPIYVQSSARGVMVVQSYTDAEAYNEKSARLLEMVAREVGLFMERRKMLEDLVVAKERAEESDRLKSAFLANMSHEIRTPMNGILGFAQLLKSPALSGDQQKRFISIIEQSGQRMLNIINDLINISKIESGQVEILRKKVNLNERLQFLYEFFVPEIQNKKQFVEFTLHLPKEEHCVYTDSEKLTAILTNLLKNAVKFTSRGHISFGYQESDNGLEFFVKDSGIGIPSDKLNAIFERFVQADMSISGPYEGAGLGLSIAKAYIEMLGGRIHVESIEGKGSSFTFTIPHAEISNARHPLRSEEVSPAASDSGKHLKVMIADDDEASDLLITMAIESVSDNIIHAKTGTEAVDICRDHPELDLIFMDIKMPELNGYDATRKIRLFNQNVVIIAQTAYALAGDREKALSAGCNDYISKPIKHKELIDIINRNISGRNPY